MLPLAPRAAVCALLAAAPLAAQRAPSLALLGREPLAGRTTYAALGLSGIHKPAGLEFRLRLDVPDSLPPHVPRREGALRLVLAQRAPEGWLALYGTPLEGRTARTNARYHAALWGADGRAAWSLPLNPFLSRTRDLEIQDVRLRGGRLFFNEACQSYSAEAGGRCSSLVRVDPVRRAVEWRSHPLVSNGVFVFAGDAIVAAYGFTREPDFLRLVSRQTGRVLATRPLDSAAQYLEERDGVLHVVTHGYVYRFRVRG